MEHGVFAVNVLADDQAQIANIFAGAVAEYRENRFAVGEWTTLNSAAPVLEGATCSFDCKLVDFKDFGSHRILIGEVIALENNTKSPLVYSERAFHRTAALAAV